MFFFVQLPSALFVLLPVFLISGPFLSDFAISLIGLNYIIYCLKYKTYGYFKSKIFIFFVIFCIYIIISSLLNSSDFYSLKSSLFYFRFGIFVGATIFLIENNKNLIKLFYISLLFCFSVLIFDSFLQYFSGQNFLGWKSESNRISSLFGDEYILGSYLSRLLPILFACAVLLKKQNENLFLYSLFILFLTEVVVFLSGERAAFFYINLSAFFILLFIQDHKITRFITLSLAIITIFIISIFNQNAKERIFDLTIKQFNIFHEKSNKDKNIYIFSKQHTHHYISAYKMFKDNKVIGVGVKNFRNKCSEEKYYVSDLSCSTHPHNTYIQFLSETGFLGFCFIILALFYVVKCFLKNLFTKRNQKNNFYNFKLCLISSFLITLWPFVPNGNFFNNWLSIIYFLPVGFFIWCSKNKA